MMFEIVALDDKDKYKEEEDNMTISDDGIPNDVVVVGYPTYLIQLPRTDC
jgi:hypothetical protein